MDFQLVIMLSLGIFIGYNAQPAGSLSFVCRNGEEFDICRSPCESTCSSIQSGITMNCTRSCVAGCYCSNGLVRASDKTCVPPEKCTNRTNYSSQCKENEEFLECGSPCAANCSNINEPIFCTKPCHSGCFCKPNFVRDSKGNCVHPGNCNTAGNRRCPRNERYVNCINLCNSCWETGDCTTHYCTPGCDCIPGFYKNIYGQCVIIEECFASLYALPLNCGENEIYSSCVNPCNDCYSKGRCAYEYYCESGCDCRRGYFRDNRGICMPERFCYRECNENQVFHTCGPACESTCENYWKLFYHPCKEQCVPGCFCPRNLVLGPNGRCIRPEQCPTAQKPCPPGEAFYHCLPTCRTTCESLETSSGLHSTECKPGCFCRPGFVRNREGKCVRPEKCPSNPRSTCPPGETYHDCAPTCRDTCDNLYSSEPCFKICHPGCFCQKGLVRRRDGICVQPRNCPTDETSIDGRRGGADDESLTDETTTTQSPQINTNESIEIEPTQSTSGADASVPESTASSAPTKAVSVTAATDSVSVATNSVTDATDSVSTVIDSVSVVTNSVTDATDSVSTVTVADAPTTSQFESEGENPSSAETTTAERENTLPDITSSATNAVETSKTDIVDEQMTTLIVGTTTNFENATSVN